MADTENGPGVATSPYFLIPCRVEPGMFRDEWLVFIDAVDPKNPERTIERTSC
jgi:hypothetical protein